ncbi:MAG: tetratricopeptide repeat protein [Opitutaceae bacterium]|nr:tetratricopeptide repeat protein [Opitutaceae bacterium]
MSRSLFTGLIFATLTTGALHAQTFYFNDGRKVAMSEARIKGSNILVSLKIEGAAADAGSAEITLPISSLNRIDWPAPPALAASNADLQADKPADALKKIDAILSEQEAFREVPGSWWNQGAVIKAIALARLGKDVDADVMIERMKRAKADSADIARAEIAVINQLVASGKTAEANTRMEKLQGAASDEESLAALAVLKASILAKAGRTEEALLAYLRVPVFSPTANTQMPAALLGAALAYQKLGDADRAASTLAALTSRFPNSPEAAQAQR